MRPNVFRVAVAVIAGGALAAAAQTTKVDLTSMCGLRYKVLAGAGTAPFDPKKSRAGAHVLTWDQLEKIRFGRTIRTLKDLPSQSSPERRVGGESTLYAIEGFMNCGVWGGRVNAAGRVGELFVTLEEDGPDSKGRSIEVGFPSTSCTYGSPNFQRLKDLNREIEPYINFSPNNHGDDPGPCGIIGRHVIVYGYGYWTDAGATATSKSKGVALSLFPVVDIVVMDKPGGVPLDPPFIPDPAEAFIASWTVTARNKTTSATARGTHRDGIWVYENFGIGKDPAAPIPFGMFIADSGNTELQKGIGEALFVSMTAPPGKQLNPSGYSFTSTTPSDKAPGFFGGAETNRASPIHASLSCFGPPTRTTFAIGREKWDCMDRGNGVQSLHLLSLQVSFSQQCPADELWRTISGNLTYTAPEQVPCAFASSGTIDTGGDSGDSADDGNADDSTCPAGFDPATDCPDPAPPEDPGPPPEDPPMIGLPGSVTNDKPLVMSTGESKTMRFIVTTMGDADVDLAVSSDSESVTAALSRPSIPLPGNGTANLTINVRDDALVGDYNVTVSATNLGMTATAPVHVAVRCDPPTILGIDQPRSTVVNRGAAATLEVKSGGSGPLQYQWYEGVTGMTFNPIPGATGKTFTTPAVNQTTDYWVRVTNPCGSVDSNPAEVTVKF